MKRFIVLLMFIFLLLAMSIPAYGQMNNSINQTELSKIKNILEQEEVPNNKQEILIQKYINGEVWDSVNPEKSHLIPEGFFEFRNGETTKKFIFPDGSFIKKSMTNGKSIPIEPKNKNLLMEVIKDEEKVNRLLKESNYSVRAFPDLYVYDHTFSYSWLSYWASFKMDFVLRDFNRSEIITPHSASAGSIAGVSVTITNWPSIIRKYETTSSPARAEMTILADFKEPMGAKIHTLAGCVGNYSYWSEVSGG